MKIIIFFIIFLSYQKIYSFEIHSQINYHHVQVKWEDYKEKEQTLNYETKGKIFHHNNIKLVSHKQVQYDFENKKITSSFWEFYLAALIKEWYFSLGRNPINWGVGMGKNPTNYFKAQEEFQYREKKMQQIKGVDSLIINYTTADNTFEGVLTDKKSAGVRFKTFIKGIDLSISYYSDYKNGLNKWGLDYVYDFLKLGWFNIYGELAYQSRRNFAYVCGINHQLSVPFRGAVGIEYMVDRKNQEDLSANFNILSQKIDLFLVSGYDLNNKGYFLMPMISFFPIEKIEFFLSAKRITASKNKRPNESDITMLEGKVSYHF